MTTALLFILGLATLVAGGDLFVKGASRLATILGMSPLVIGLTVVALGTSAPELGVSILAALGGHADLALGNVTGSNVFNVLGVLGVSALITPLAIHTNLVRFDVPVMIFVSILMGVLAWGGEISRIEGAFLFICAISYTWILLREARRETKKNLDEGDHEVVKKDVKSYVLIGLFIILGLVGLVFGARWTVDAAIEIAKYFAISERVIALTIVAIGTSLPELVTSAVAGLRGQRDLAVGNVVGSNILNILVILGLTSMISPTGIAVATAAQRVDIPLTIFVAALCFPFFKRQVMGRFVGAFFLFLYAGYVVYLIASGA